MLGDDAGEPRYVERTYFYDYKKRLMQVVERNPEGGISRTSYDYDLVGNVVRYKELRQPYAGADEDMVTASYVYDNRRRLIREVRALNYENSVAVDYEYDDLGKLVGKTTRNGGLNTTMAYNLQGWQTDMQVTDSGSPLFDTHLRYYDPQYGETTPSYAGNISEWTWRQGGESDENTYAFTYDSHSRLTDTDQYINGEFDNQFVEDYMSYDYNGNIKFLKRYEHGILKNYYVYRYNGNQLTALDDLSASSPATSSWITPASSAALGDPEPTPDPAVPVIPRDTIYSGVGYVYDSAGNVLYDSHTGLNLRYNDLNLIEKVMRGDTIVAKYSYLSDGTKLSATDSAGNGLYYSGSLVYSKHGSALTMESCAFTGGRFVATATGVEARYFVTDHLGSVRAVVNDDGEVLERNDYYPFGSRWDDGLLSDNRYRYNGKEAQAFLNNPYLDYGARQYDSDGAIWLGKDPLSEKYYPISPYVFCLGNPILYKDPTGLAPIYDPEGNLIGTDDGGLQGEAIIMNRDDFIQGMAHDDAIVYNMGESGFVSDDARMRYENSYQGLADRPDYDGKLTLKEANEWYRSGSGEPLYVDASKIDLSPVTTQDLEEGIGKYINFASLSYANKETGLVYGNIKLTLIDSDGTVKLGGVNGLLDNYGFEMHKGGSVFRNMATRIGRVVAGKGVSYNIYNYNNGKVKVK